MRRILLLLPLLIFSTPAYAQELNLDCITNKFYMRDGDPNGVVEGLLGDRYKANIFWQGDTIIVKWTQYVADNQDLPFPRQVDINRSTGKKTEVIGGEAHTISCNKIESVPRKF